MKNLVKIAFVFALAVIVFAACSKDQKCVNWLEGADWKVTKIETTDSNGVTVDEIAAITAQGLSFDAKFVFDKYSVKNDENGAATFYTAVSGTVFGIPVNELDTMTYDYRIEDDCETVWLKETGATTAETSTIEEASKSKMVFSSYDETEKSTTRITIEKQ